MLTVVYPGTFDPFTLGHHDIVLRASRLFDQVVVGIAQNPSKSPWFSLEERLEMARSALEEVDNVRVEGFDDLLLKFLERHRSKVVIRGLRAVSDFEYEMQMAGMNRHLNPAMDTVFLTPSERFTFVSATMVREIAYHQGNVRPFVTAEVAERLRHRALDIKKKRQSAGG